MERFCRNITIFAISKFYTNLYNNIIMSELKTTFAGLELKNPFIVSSSSLTNSAEKNLAWEKAGAGAIVLKSLFEEQILWECSHIMSEEHPDAGDYLQGYLRAHYLDEYTKLIKESKQKCSIPIIASINCYTDQEWESFATMLQEAGADALELNLMAIQTKIHYEYGSFEQSLINILKHVVAKIQVPVIVKLGSNLTNPISLIDQLYANGAKAVVLFNRLYQTDIDIERMSYCSGQILSDAGELAHALRWIGIGSAAVPNLDFAASGGVSNGSDIVKCLLAGASAVEVCSILYKDGETKISEVLNELREWMNRHQFSDIDSFKGRLKARDLENATVFERTQFLKYFGGKQ